MRASTEEQRRLLKWATDRAIRAACGPHQLALDTRVEAPALTKYGSRDPEWVDRYMPIDVALDADISAGSPIIAVALAHAQGFRLVPDERRQTAGIVDAGDYLDMSRQFSAITVQFANALDDGRIDAAERRALAKSIDDEIAALQALAAKIGGA